MIVYAWASDELGLPPTVDLLSAVTLAQAQLRHPRASTTPSPPRKCSSIIEGAARFVASVGHPRESTAPSPSRKHSPVTPAKAGAQSTTVSGFPLSRE